MPDHRAPVAGLCMTVAAVASCSLGAQLFAQPPSGSLTSAPRLRASSVRPLEGQGDANGAGLGAASLLGFGLASAALAAARASRTAQATRTARVHRNFFGGDSGSSYKAFDPATELGVQEPVGFWDPLGFTADGDEEAFKRRRSVEIKHGRICMIASIGYIVPEYYKFPGFISPSLGVKFEDIPNGLAAISKVPALGWVQIFFFAGVIEGKFGFDDYKSGTPGEFGWTVITSADPAEKSKKLSAELANGRLAMVAIIGMFFQDGLTGSAWGDWALYEASPLRAQAAAAEESGAGFVGTGAASASQPTRSVRVQRHFFGGDSSSSYKSFDPATELGVQEPVGFWDPLGFTADGDETAFKRRRSVEIKHGRICMIASIGYIVPEYYKFPGFISPSLGVKFEDIPNGLAAISKVPALGWVQIFFFAGVIEGKFGFDDYKSGTPGEFGWTVITSADPAEKSKKLSAELANGRLAMVAIIGMFFQDGLTGSAWGDWALYEASPLRAAEEDAPPPPPPPFDPAGEVGAMAPLGFFDPAGFSKVGDEEGFRNLRMAELKHARVAMMAALGGVVQHFIKFPGFESVPSGIKAVITPPGTYGFAALFAVAGALELAIWTQDPNKEVGDFGDPLGVGTYDEDTRNKEINNGRFAMFAALGIIAAELVTGKDAIQQFGL